MKFIDT